MTQRIVHVVESLEPEAGAVAISLAGLFNALSKNGVSSSAITADGSCGSVRWAREERRNHAEARRMIAEADAVHLHGWGNDLARSAGDSARRAGTPVVISPLGGLTEGPYRRLPWSARLRHLFSDKALIRYAGVVTALNSVELSTLEAGKVHARVVLLPYGIDTREYENAGGMGREEGEAAEAHDEKCLLVLGPIHPGEGLVPLLRAFGEIMSEAPGWRIVIAGEDKGKWRRMLEAAIRRKGASDKVSMADAPDPAAQRSWLQRADLLASPALHIRCPVSIMQAMAAGVNVIASEWVAPAGLDGTITTCGVGRKQLGMALRSAIALPDEERAAAAARARKLAQSLFDWSVLVGKYLQLYRSLG